MNNLSNVPRVPRRMPGGLPIVLVILGVIVVLFLLNFARNFFYAFERVDEQEVAVQFQGGKIKNVVGPGIYTDVGLFVDIVRVSSQAIPFSVTDDEIITKDKQRIGLVVSGDIFRPNITQKDTIQDLWAQYRSIYLEDELARSRMQDQARQAMKVCIGDRTFDDNVVGTARDVLRQCIDDELNVRAANFGLRIENLVVPDVILSPAVQSALDAIVQSRLETEKAAQDKLRADAQADAEQARQEGEIRIEQSRIQEQARQQTALAQLEEQKVAAQRAVIEAERANELARVEAERAVIEAQKNNDLIAAQRDIEIAQAQAVAAEEQAKAQIAYVSALAELYAGRPDYVQLLIAQANASALKSTDKVIFTPEGVTPTLVLPGPGIVPTVETTSQ
ncbi:MAG: SPFH domain-containing protein [Caldilineaceae bacterium]|nr:SPFH domain-containing protein [Caldilineaceae bacterium]MCY4118591.1 SPFH domain-containing protein [Caldilineaceae bacterium]MDE0072215.1 SPFH domain-containing protein [Caldilineaceae bacterium]